MSDIIIEGKNLDDINQSNFQTVGVRSSFYAPTTDFNLTADPNAVVISQTESDLSFNFPNDFRFGTLEDHANRFGQTIDAFGEFGFLLKNTTVEPWQGRLHYDYDIESLNEEYFNFVKGIGQNFISGVGYPYFFRGDVFFTQGLRYKIPNTFERVDQIDYFEETSEEVNLERDPRFSLGTYTENNKQFWERQTTDPRTRKSQFTRSKMKTAFGKLLTFQSPYGFSNFDPFPNLEPVITSDEERFSVDALLFTDRESKRTPLCFYYDKDLHPTEYKLATNGKVFMQIELRDSGRDVFNQIDLYSERKAYRPFRLGFVKEELDGGRGEVFGEGLYTAESRITITSTPAVESYMIGIFDSDGDLRSSNETYTFYMPEQDVEYQARFRPNPTVVVKTRYIDFDSGELIQDAGEESKGQVKAFPSYNSYDSNEEEYSVAGLDGTAIPEFSPLGEDFVSNVFRPTLFGGSQYTIQVNEVTSNYTANSFTYVSSSDGTEIELPTSTQTGADADLNQNEARKQKSFELKEHFRYPLVEGEDRTILIYVTYTSAAYVIENYNNLVDFENGSLEEAILYGPIKYAILPNRFTNTIDNPTIFDDEVRLQLYNNTNTLTNPTPPPVLVLDDPIISDNNLELPRAYLEYNGYNIDSGSFQVYQKNFIGNDALVSEIKAIDTALPPTTLSHAISINNNIAPIVTQGPTTDPPEFEVGDITNANTGIGGAGGMFKLLQINTEEINNEDDQTTEFVYQYIWGVNMDFTLNGLPYYETVQPFKTIYHLSDSYIEQGRRGVELTPNLQPNNLLASSGETTPIINTETTSSIRYVALQEGTYVKSVLQNGIDTTIDLTNVGPNEIVRPKEDSGVINANMFNFGEQVRFQITPSEPAEEPTYQMWAYTENGSEFPPGIYKISGNGSPFPELTKASLGVTFDWNGGGNFGTLNYNMPESRDATVEVGGVEYPAWFRYVEFRFTVPQEEDFDGNEGGNEQDNEFHVRLNAMDIPGNGGQITLDDNTVIGIGNNALDLFPTEDGDFSELTVEQRTIRLKAIPAYGVAEGMWSVVADPGVNANTIGIIDQVSGPGSTDDIIDFTINGTGEITIAYNWSGDDSSGGPS